MELLAYWQILRKRLWLILLIMVVGSGGAAYYSQQQPLEYRTTTTLFLNPAGASPLLPYQTTKTVQSLANTYIEFMRTRSFARLVLQESELALTEEELLALISTDFVLDTQFFRISAVHSDPQTAQTIANTAANVLIAQNTARQQAEQQQRESQQAQSGNPELKRLMELRAALEEEVTFYNEQIKALQEQIATLQRAPSSAETNERLKSLRGELIQLQGVRVQTLMGLAQTEINLITATPKNPPQLDTAVVVDAAELPSSPLPREILERTLMGLAASMVLGVGLAFLLEYLDYTVKTPEALEAIYKLPIQGVIGIAARKKLKDQHHLAVLKAPHTPIAEAFRALRTSIRVAGLNAPVQSILITSAGPNEGKTFVATNLAISLAQNGSRVILVDTDLRKPTLHHIFGLPREPGFTNLVVNQYLKRLSLMRPKLRAIYERARNHEALKLRYGNPARKGEVSFNAIDGFLREVETDDPELLAWITELRGILGQQDPLSDFLQRTEVENLWVLTCGAMPPNPAELLGSPRAAQVMEQLEAYADIVIYDSPPAATVTDATVIAPRVDAVLHVVQAGLTRIEVIRRCKNILERVGARILGPVLNQISHPDMGWYAAYYNHDYYHPNLEQQRPTGSIWRWLGLQRKKRTLIVGNTLNDIE